MNEACLSRLSSYNLNLFTGYAVGRWYGRLYGRSRTNRINGWSWGPSLSTGHSGLLNGWEVFVESKSPLAIIATTHYFSFDIRPRLGSEGLSPTFCSRPVTHDLRSGFFMTTIISQSEWSSDKEYVSVRGFSRWREIFLSVTASMPYAPISDYFMVAHLAPARHLTLWFSPLNHFLSPGEFVRGTGPTPTGVDHAHVFGDDLSIPDRSRSLPIRVTNPTSSLVAQCW